MGISYPSVGRTRDKSLPSRDRVTSASKCCRLSTPFPLEALSPGVIKKDVPIGPAHIGALGECLTATHGILDTILSIQLDILLTLPVIFCKLQVR